MMFSVKFSMDLNWSEASVDQTGMGIRRR